MSDRGDEHGPRPIGERISAAPPSPLGDDPRATRWLHVVAIVLVTAALIGFFTGTRGEEAPHRRAAPPAVVLDGPTRLAPTYAAIRATPLGPDRDRHAAAIDALRADHPALGAPVPPRDDEAVRGELARRASLRAYDGAPPRIPHPIPAFGALECVVCHRDGLRLDGRVAPPMSHRELGSCVQCHVPDEGEMPGARLGGGPPLESTFAGRPSPERGVRAWPVAPPQIPHSTLMRERCDSCHGVWASALRTTHPERGSCTQCHAPSGALDQHPASLLGAGPPVGAP